MAFSLFPAIYDHPAHIRLAHQEPDEYIELFLRQHWATNVPWIVSAILAAALPIVLPCINKLFGSVVTMQLPGEILASFLILWYLLVLAYILEKFLHWYFNIYIVTNTHLVDVDFLNLMYRSITSARLDDVQSAKSRISGIFRSLFNYGDVAIETAAKGQTLEFLAVPQPDFVADRIEDLRELQESGGESNVS
ncbi:MAG: PH domain-containing protein [Candidatus Daviesbacteria bacterium]